MRWKRILVNVVIFAACAGVGLVAIDLYLRTTEVYTPMKTRIDPVIGPRFAPGVKVARFNEGFCLTRINEHGFLGPSVPPRPEPGERRIELIGDSFVLGQQVFPRDHFGTLLSRKLSRDAGRPVPVLNFGQDDFHLGNMLLFHRDFAARWNCDLVLYFVENEDLIIRGHENTDLYPGYVLEGDSLRVDRSFADSPAFAQYRRFEPVAVHSSLFRMALIARQTLLRGGFYDVVLGKFAPLLTRHLPLPAAIVAARKHPSPGPITAAILHEIAQDPRARLVLKKELPPASRALLEESGIPLWDLQPVLYRMRREGLDPYYWPMTGVRGHWTHEAHRRIAEYLRERVEADPGWQGPVGIKKAAR